MFWSDDLFFLICQCSLHMKVWALSLLFLLFCSLLFTLLVVTSLLNVVLLIILFFT